MIPATVRIFVFTEPVDMRRGFDSLALIARDRMAQDPRSGALLIFSNRHTNRIKALWWDTTGYCLLYKRAHKALFSARVCAWAARPCTAGSIVCVSSSRR
jgi:transposase